MDEKDEEDGKEEDDRIERKTSGTSKYNRNKDEKISSVDMYSLVRRRRSRYRIENEITFEGRSRIGTFVQSTSDRMEHANRIRYETEHVRLERDRRTGLSGTVL